MPLAPLPPDSSTNGMICQEGWPSYCICFVQVSLEVILLSMSIGQGPDTGYDPNSLILRAQVEHVQVLRREGLLAAVTKALANQAATLTELSTVHNGRALVLGSERGDQRKLFIGFQVSHDGSDVPSISTKLVEIGDVTSENGGTKLGPKEGYEVAQLAIVNTLYDELRGLVEQGGSTYDLERGIFRV